MTQPVLSAHARAEARFARHHSGNPPTPSAPLRPLWHEAASVVGFVLFLAACAVLL